VDAWPNLSEADRIEISAIARKGNVTPLERACGIAVGEPQRPLDGGDTAVDQVDPPASPQPGEVDQHPTRRGGVGIEYWACPMCLRKLPALGMVFCSTWCMSEWEEQTTAPVLQVIPPLKTLTDLHSLYWQQAIENTGNQGK